MGSEFHRCAAHPADTAVIVEHELTGAKMVRSPSGIARQVPPRRGNRSARQPQAWSADRPESVGPVWIADLRDHGMFLPVIGNTASRSAMTAGKSTLYQSTVAGGRLRVMRVVQAGAEVDDNGLGVLTVNRLFAHRASWRATPPGIARWRVPARRRSRNRAFRPLIGRAVRHDRPSATTIKRTCIQGQ